MKTKVVILVAVLVPLVLLATLISLVVMASKSPSPALSPAPVFQSTRISDADALNAQYAQEREEARRDLVILNQQLSNLLGEYRKLESQRVEYSHSVVTSSNGHVYDVDTERVRPEIQDRMQELEPQIIAVKAMKRQCEEVLAMNRTAR